jgi:hypothetical protein
MGMVLMKFYIMEKKVIWRKVDRSGEKLRNVTKSYILLNNKDRQCTSDVTSRHVRVTIITAEKQ